MKGATAKTLIATAVCLVAVVSYAGAHGTGSVRPRNKPGVHKKVPNKQQRAQRGGGSGGQSGGGENDLMPTPTALPTATPTATPSTNG